MKNLDLDDPPSMWKMGHNIKHQPTASMVRESHTMENSVLKWCRLSQIADKMVPHPLNGFLDQANKSLKNLPRFFCHEFNDYISVASKKHF